MSDFVLLHGTTQSARGWDRLVAELTDRGHSCWSVDLPSSEDLDAAGYASAVVAQLGAGPSRPVVVAHSGGGLLLPAAARALRAAHQVWLAAAIPDGRRSLLDELQEAPEEIFNPEWIGQDPTSDPVLAAYFLFHDTDLATLQWALGTVRAFIPARLYREPVQPAADISSTYVVCTTDRTLRPDWSRREAVARLGADVVEIDAGHCPHVSQPARLADLIAPSGS